MHQIGGEPKWKSLSSPPPETFVPGKKGSKRKDAVLNTTQFNEPMDKPTWQFLSNQTRRGLNSNAWRAAESPYVAGLHGRNKNLCAQGDFCSGSLGYSRELMPQLKPSINFITTLSKYYKINSNVILRKRSSLVPVQGEICKPKVNRKVEALLHDKSKAAPANILNYLESDPFAYDVDPESVVVSSDGPTLGQHYIIDGHHKWAATKLIDAQQGTDTDIVVIVIQAPYDIILDIAKTLQYPAIGMNHPNPYKGCYTPEEMAHFNAFWAPESYSETEKGNAQKAEQKSLQKKLVKKWLKNARTRKARYQPITESNAALKETERIMAQRRRGRV
jgi:hypothetical protein